MISESQKGTLTIVVLICAWFCVGWGNTWEEIQKATDQVSSIKAEFIQEKRMEVLTRPLISKGVFYFSAPSSLHWEYRTPVRSILLMHNGQTERYVETGEGLSRDAGTPLHALQTILEQITGWITGRFEDNPLFSSSLDPDRKIILIPKDAAFSRMIQKIELTLSDRPGVMESITIFESSDSMTRITFENVIVNAQLDDSLFRGT